MEFKELKEMCGLIYKESSPCNGLRGYFKRNTDNRLIVRIKIKCVKAYM